MTRDEQRQAWRTYAAALLAGEDVDLLAVSKAADWMVKEERKRFDQPDHIADANKMVEPPETRPWVGLTQGDIEGIVRYWQSDPPCAYAELVALVEGCLREKNGGMR